jgi:hypothetical protein
MKHLTPDPPIIAQGPFPARHTGRGRPSLPPAVRRVALNELENFTLERKTGLTPRQQVCNEARVLGDLFTEARRLHARRFQVVQNAGRKLGGFLFHEAML